jgi:aspartyl-tRNA(Asn)/glutamyl-tRNA(Gln) amidotransferase subunit B
MYHKTIGLEIHLKIKSTNKLFCQCKNLQDFDTILPNTNICPVCTGQPGALPVLSQHALEKSLLLWQALACTIQSHSSFDRKSYFYPDLPMGYQITQYFSPTCVDGELSFFVGQFANERKVSIRQSHMETDTAKMIHDGGQALIDYNRAGTPLVEVVTGPDFSDADEVSEFLKELQRIARYNNISDADMEKWQMRVDVNISIRTSLDAPLGTRVELKNINSFGAVRRAIDHEYTRQVSLLENGWQIEQETRWRDDAAGNSYSMRSKENALDYRYFPEPDLPTLLVQSEKYKAQNGDVIIPFVVVKKLKEEYWFHKEYINALINDKAVLDYFQDCVVAGCDPKHTVKWIAGPITAYMTQYYKTIDSLPFSFQQFVWFLGVVQQGKVLDAQLKLVMEEMLETGRDAQDIIVEQWFDAPAVSDDALRIVAQWVLDAHPAIVQQYKDGKTTTIGFFVWQVMKQTWGKTNPKDATQILTALLQ